MDGSFPNGFAGLRQMLGTVDGKLPETPEQWVPTGYLGAGGVKVGGPWQHFYPSGSSHQHEEDSNE